MLMPILLAQDLVGTKSLSMFTGVSGDESRLFSSPVPEPMYWGPYFWRKELAPIQPPPTRTCSPPCEIWHKIFFPVLLPKR